MPDNNSLRIVFWNIWHGGGNRAGKIVEQILDWEPDIIALAEFRGTPPSTSIAKRLSDAGYIHQLKTTNADEPAWNALFLASRFELTPLNLEGAPKPDYLWLLATVAAKPAMRIGVMHVPLERDLPGYWRRYHEAILNLAEDQHLGPALFLGDMNSGLSGLDEETQYSQGYKGTFMKPMESRGWLDPFRVFHPDADAPTWFSTSNNGFRLDQAFVSTELRPKLASCKYDWGRPWEQKNLSDHAALLLDLYLGG